MNEEKEKPRLSLFRKVYNWVLHWADTPYALTASFLVAFGSAWILPVPPDILLIPILLARPEKAIRLGLVTAFLYFLGWLLGYTIGYYAQIWFGEALLQKLGLYGVLEGVRPLYDEYGWWAVLSAAATPLSDKVFSMGSGALRYNFGSFASAAALGCLLRIMIPALLLKYFGAPVQRFVEKNLEWFVLGAIGAAFTVFLIWRTLK